MRKSFAFLFWLIIVNQCLGQNVAEVGFISRIGSAHNIAKPQLPLCRGQSLSINDEIILTKNTQVRILFLETGTSRKYKGPASIKISEEIAALSRQLSSADRDNVALWLRDYYKPVYSQFSGDRPREQARSMNAANPIKTFLTNPHLVVLGDGQSHRIIVKSANSKMPPIERLIPPQKGPVSLQLTEKNLNHGSIYHWRVDEVGPFKILQIIPQKEAIAVNNRLKQLRDDAIDPIEFHELAATYLLESGFLAEAFIYVERGLSLEKGNAALMYLKNNLMETLPACTALGNDLSKQDILLRYAFQRRIGEEHEEIRDQSILHSGDEFQIRILAPQDCYIFIINVDAAQNLTVLFPAAGQDHFIAAGKLIILPEEYHYYRADSTTGNERLYIIASALPLDFLARELDRFFSLPAEAKNSLRLMAKLNDQKFHRIQDTPGEPDIGIAAASGNLQLTRFLQGSGCIVREISFFHDR